MIWGINNNERISAIPHGNATCPICNSKLIAKCGNIKIHHWCHKANKDCDNWYEPESEWHLNWKDEFPKEYQEFVMGNHRADIRTKKRWIIELQNSAISQEEIKEREEYYKRMIWLLNGETLGKNLNIETRKNNYVTFKWKYFPKSWFKAEKEVYVDLGNDTLLLIRKINNGKWSYEDPYGETHYKKYSCSGWGYLISKQSFLKTF